jgi:hypothetical protein
MNANLELMRAGLDAKINKEAAPLGKSSEQQQSGTVSIRLIVKIVQHAEESKILKWRR